MEKAEIAAEVEKMLMWALSDKYLTYFDSPMGQDGSGYMQRSLHNGACGAF